MKKFFVEVYGPSVFSGEEGKIWAGPSSLRYIHAVDALKYKRQVENGYRRPWYVRTVTEVKIVYREE